jgi:hypothetical protein
VAFRQNYNVKEIINVGAEAEVKDKVKVKAEKKNQAEIESIRISFSEPE